jgi:cyanophycin synthetase
VKPYDGNHGRGVSLNLMTESDVKAAYELAARKGDSSAVLVESFITGDEHRLLVVGNKLIVAAKGESLWVDGDGVSTVLDLVNTQINIDPRRGEGEDFPLGTVKPHESGEIVLELQRQGMTALSVPQAGQKVLIQPNGNVAIDVTDDVHPSVVHAALLAARVVGLDIAGIDLVTTDITRPLEEQRGAIIEVNASPGLLAHIKPGVGQPRPVGAAIVDHLFAPEETGRIPLIGVTGTRGASLIVRMLCKLLNLSGLHTGAVCSEGMYLDQRRVVSNDCVNWDAGQRLLLNRTVQTALFESNPRMILAEGLAYDKCQVGIVTDMGSLESVKDFDVLDEAGLYKAVRSQVDVVVPTGVAVLNAANAHVLELAELCDGTVTLYAQDGSLQAIAAQLAAGQRAVFVRGNHIVLAEGGIETVLLCLDLLKPATAGNVDSVLAVAAAAWAMNRPVDLICAGLRTFDAAPGCIGN